jgi:hypothetical protein
MTAAPSSFRDFRKRLARLGPPGHIDFCIMFSEQGFEIHFARSGNASR